MTLEEKINFFSREDANEFQKYLREKGCSSRISVDYEFSGTPHFEGTIDSFLKFAEKLCAKEESQETSELKDELAKRKEILENFLKSHKAGDVLTESMPSQILARLESIGKIGTEIEKDAAQKFSETLMIFGTLDENELLEEIKESDGYILKGVKDAGSLSVMYPYTDIDNVESDDLEDTGISSHIISSSETKFTVTVDPEILFSSDIDDMADALDGLDVDEEESARFIDAVFFKKVFVSKILDFVDAGAKSEAEILESLSAPYFKLSDTGDKISFYLSPEYISEVVSDLKKLGYLSGKDGKIKSN